MHSSGELDHSPRQLSRQAVVNVCRDLIRSEAILSVVDDSLRWNSGAAHNPCARYFAGHLFNIGAEGPVDHPQHDSTPRLAAVVRSRQMPVRATVRDRPVIASVEKQEGGAAVAVTGLEVEREAPDRPVAKSSHDVDGLALPTTVCQCAAAVSNAEYATVGRALAALAGADL